MKSHENADPVLPDQGGRMMASDPGANGREQAIRRRAYELYLGRGCKDGHHLKDWFEAETEICTESMEVHLSSRS